MIGQLESVDIRLNYERNFRSEKNRVKHLVRTYGITVEEYENLLKEQNGVCAICANPPGKRRLAVDHDHETGLVRGLLCSPCNTGIGLLKNVDNLTVAISYLESS